MEEEEYNPQFEFGECCKYCDEDTGIEIFKNFDVDPCLMDENGTSPLHACAANGLMRLLELIVAKPGVNLNVQNPSGNTPLHFAAINRNSRVIKLLVESGADPKIRNSKGKSPLYHAVDQLGNKPSKAESEAVDLLIGPDSEIPEPITGADATDSLNDDVQEVVDETPAATE